MRGTLNRRDYGKTTFTGQPAYAVTIVMAETRTALKMPWLYLLDSKEPLSLRTQCSFAETAT
jgi:hypothetical protein